MPDRHEPFREIARTAGLDAIALVPGANFTRLYAHDFHQNERPLVVVIPADGPPAAVVPNLELGSFAALGFEGEVFDWRDQDGYRAAFDALFAHLATPGPASASSADTMSGGTTSSTRPAGPTASDGRALSLGVEGQTMRVFVEQALRRGAGAAGRSLDVVDVQRDVAALRLKKDDVEIDALRLAIRITETALAETVAEVRAGLTEKAIESLLVQRLFANGADDFAFSPIVAAGDNSAHPHASARSDYAVRAGDALLIDFGARRDGLCADITRTFFVGHCSDAHAEIHATVLAANEAGRAASRPGASAHDVDEAATAVLEGSRHAARIRHKTGHGLGRDVHEDPYIMRGNDETLSPGTVFTVEPGLYELGDLGVRIEDDVLITESGHESLTTFERGATVLG